ncbi:hypothetical protein W02_17090 [Nitrospira sp. KM1]|uniref:hypothetical protein n=1 Tax=Nitrospira sp. KM1 TaxID=1936990 RepID=UPI0013A75ABF|nr:hypothetical protein [Nitrospira sp. KM1]BCA54569.1 hypothetical protein W02_17090 [Nitrospira sp. KM1]
MIQMVQQDYAAAPELCVEDVVQTEGPGIMVFSPVLDLLHMNRRAVKLIREFLPGSVSSTRPVSAAETLPPPLSYLAGKIIGMLQEHDEMGDRSECTVSYLAATLTTRVLIRCLGLPGRKASEESRIVFILTESGHRSDIPTSPTLTGHSI